MASRGWLDLEFETEDGGIGQLKRLSVMAGSWAMSWPIFLDGTIGRLVSLTTLK